MDASVYHPLFLLTVSCGCIAVSFTKLSSGNERTVGDRINPLAVATVGFILAVYSIWIGNRPISGYYFGDTINYALSYANFDPAFYHFSFTGEWVWEGLMYLCQTAGLDISGFFTLVAFLYVFTAYAAVIILMPRDVVTATLFVLSSLMFFSFCTNGLRNGLACHTIILAIAIALRGGYLPAALLAFLAFGTHRSTILPIAATVGALATWRIDGIIKYAVWFWTGSIFVSLVAGDAVTNLFTGLGFDDRMDDYITDTDFDQFSRSGFRWDFLIYSAMPVVMSWYVGVKRKMADNWFTVISIVYCLCNAFWVMVIRSSFSNRFAYLSWFLYPVVIAYPLIESRAFGKKQNTATACILLLYVGFTLFMNIFYW